MFRMIKKVVVLMVIVLAVLVLPGNGIAAPLPALAQEQGGVSIVDADGRMIMTDLPPIIVEGRTLVPLSALATILQAKVVWEPEQRTAMMTRGSDVIRFRVDSDQARKNGQVLPLGVPVRIIGDRVYVPLRAVIDTLGVKVVWDEATRTVQLVTGLEKP